MEKRRRFLTGILLAGIIFGITGCGADSMGVSATSEASATAEAYDMEDVYTRQAAENDDYAEEGTTGEDDAGEVTGEAAEEEEAVSERKLIRTVDMQVETEEFDTLLVNLESRVKESGGYIEAKTTYNNSLYDEAGNRSASLTLRIPSEKLDSFLAQVSEESNITYQSEQVTDVTLNYVDLESHKTALEEEQERLLALMAQAETMEEIIALENSLTDVRYQLESMESQLRTYDNQIDYSTVSLSVQEVKSYSVTEEASVLSRIGSGFVERVEAIGDGFAELLIWIVIHIPDLILVAAVAAVIIVFIKKHDKKKKKTDEKNTDEKNTDEKNTDEKRN